MSIEKFISNTKTLKQKASKISVQDGLLKSE
jgi:hypothetical protein